MIMNYKKILIGLVLFIFSIFILIFILYSFESKNLISIGMDLNKDCGWKVSLDEDGIVKEGYHDYLDDKTLFYFESLQEGSVSINFVCEEINLEDDTILEEDSKGEVIKDPVDDKKIFEELNYIVNVDEKLKIKLISKDGTLDKIPEIVYIKE